MEKLTTKNVIPINAPIKRTFTVGSVSPHATQIKAKDYKEKVSTIPIMAPFLNSI